MVKQSSKPAIMPQVGKWGGLRTNLSHRERRLSFCLSSPSQNLAWLALARTLHPILRGRVSCKSEEKELAMLGWAVTFLIIALIAGLLGFTGIYVAAAGIAKILFVVFLVLFLVSLLVGGFRRPIV
jgi:uncharacterized membrane protein YtjA (UPF0391 family)